MKVNNMNLTVILALLFCVFVGCSDEGNRVIDTTDRRPPPSEAEMEEFEKAMEAAAEQDLSP